MNKKLCYLCSEIHQFEELRKQSIFTDSFKKESNSKDEFIKIVSKFIFEQLFKYNSTNRKSQKIFLKLKKSGYNYREISDALAEAWYDNSEYFFLEKKSIVEIHGSKKIIVLISLLFGIISTLISLLIFRKVAFVEFTKTMVFAVILIPSLGVAFSYIYYSLFSLIKYILTGQKT
jgi:hypothetical protein